MKFFHFDDTDSKKAKDAKSNEKKGGFFSKLFKSKKNEEEPKKSKKNEKNFNANNNRENFDYESITIESPEETTAHEADCEDNSTFQYINSKTLNKNQNNNNHIINDVLHLRKAKSSPDLKANQLELNDEFLDQLNDNFEDLMMSNYADARVTINYFVKKNIVSISFFSIINQTNSILTNVHVLIDIFYEDKWQRRLDSKIDSITMLENEEKSFDQNFLIEFKKFDIKRIKLNIFIVGKRLEINNHSSKSNIILTSNLSMPEMQILGGAHIVLNRLIY